MTAQDIVPWVMLIGLLLNTAATFGVMWGRINARIVAVEKEALRRSEENRDYNTEEHKAIRREASDARHTLSNKLHADMAELERKVDNMILVSVSKADFHMHMGRLEAQMGVVSNGVTAINTRIDSVINHFGFGVAQVRKE